MNSQWQVALKEYLMEAGVLSLYDGVARVIQPHFIKLLNMYIERGKQITELEEKLEGAPIRSPSKHDFRLAIVRISNGYLIVSNKKTRYFTTISEIGEHIPTLLFEWFEEDVM